MAEYLLMVVKNQITHKKNCPGTIEESLFVRIGEGDNAALEKLYLMTERAVYALIFSILKDPDATQDVVQETYLKIRGAAHLYRPQGKPLAWIFTIAKNLAVSTLRQRKTCQLSDEVLPENDLRYSCIFDPSDRIVLSAALTILEEEERKVVLLHAVSGITHREIAQAFEMPLSTVLSRYYRAIQKLKKHLKEKGTF